MSSFGANGNAITGASTLDIGEVVLSPVFWVVIGVLAVAYVVVLIMNRNS